MPEGEGTIIPEEEPGTGTTTGEGEGTIIPEEEPGIGTTTGEGEGTIIPEEEPGTGTTTGEGEGATTPVEEEPTLSPEEITTLKDILREDPSSKNILGLWKKMQTLESKMKKLETMFQIGTREPEEIFNEATEDTDIIYFQIQTDEN